MPASSLFPSSGPVCWMPATAWFRWRSVVRCPAGWTSGTGGWSTCWVATWTRSSTRMWWASLPSRWSPPSTIVPSKRDPETPEKARDPTYIFLTFSPPFSKLPWTPQLKKKEGFFFNTQIQIPILVSFLFFIFYLAQIILISWNSSPGQLIVLWLNWPRPLPLPPLSD